MTGGKVGSTAETLERGLSCGIISCLGGLCYGGNRDKEQDCGTSPEKAGKTTAESGKKLEIMVLQQPGSLAGRHGDSPPV